MENSTGSKKRASDTEDLIEIKTLKGNSNGEIKDKDPLGRINSADVTTDFGASQSTPTTSGGQAEIKSTPAVQDEFAGEQPSGSNPRGQTRSSSMFKPMQRIIYTQPARIPHKTVGAVEKRPSTYIVLSAVSFFINPLCGALAVWQSLFSDKAFLVGDIEGARIRGVRARTFSVLGILLSAAAAVTTYFFWIKAFEEPSPNI